MGLDRGVLARVDRRLLAGLGGDETWRMVRVPTTAAMWSTWRRYCESAGVSMGRGIAILIGHELAWMVDDTCQPGVPVISDRAGEELARREAEVTRRERDLEARGHRVDPTAKPLSPPDQLRGKVGRNEPCPCGSGCKYKRCHGSPATTRRRVSGTDGPWD